MQKLIQKADVLIEALPYIQDFRGAVIVVKFGGSAMEDGSCVDVVLKDVAFMDCAGMLPVIVHGGGKAISRSLEREGIESRFLHGLRVTCEKTIAVVRRVLQGEVNPSIVKGLTSLGAQAQSVIGEEIFRVTRKTGKDPETGRELDWGFVGEPGEVNTEQIEALLERSVIPVISPLGLGPDGKPHNINADTAAAAVAGALRSRKLVYLSDVPGVLAREGDAESIVPTLTAADVDELMDEGVIRGGMLPKLRSSLEALEAGVGKVHMIDGRIPHSLLLEIFTDKGVGTEIVRNEQT